MARDALGKLQEADEISKIASRIRKRDAIAARKLDNVAHKKRESAIRQFGRKPKKRSTTSILPRR